MASGGGPGRRSPRSALGNLFGHWFSLASAIGSLAFLRCIVGRDRAPESVGAIPAAAMDQERVEEQGVAGGHLDVDARFRFNAFRRKEPEVDVFPVGVAVLTQPALVTSRNHRQAAVLPGCGIDGRPSGDDFICGPVGEIAKVLLAWGSVCGSPLGQATAWISPWGPLWSLGLACERDRVVGIPAMHSGSRSRA